MSCHARLGLIAGAAVLLLGGRAIAQSPVNSRLVRINVLSLFHPTELVLRPAGSTLTLEVDGQHSTLLSGSRPITIRAVDSHLQARFPAEFAPFQGGCIAANPQAMPGGFVLEVPGKLRRQYAGSLEICIDRARSGRNTLRAVVAMPLETAVASIVQAESPPQSAGAMEALKAQAVAARSFLVARQAGHIGFDFCDTTHCQFLRSPPDAGSPASRAAIATAGLILVWHDDANTSDRPLAAMYARSCGGHTRTLREIGVRTTGYPYYAVHCVYCTSHPELWQSQAQPHSAHLSERDRLAFNRVHGWAAIPSLSATSSQSSASEPAYLLGRGIGHGLGLCQLGAADMARKGASFQEILAHYYPNTHLSSAAVP